MTAKDPQSFRSKAKKISSLNNKLPSYKHPMYQTWRGMIRRCHDKKYKDYYLYGARGIKVQKSWFDIEVFAKDMGPKPTKRHSLDRIDNNGNYGPKNCRWATPKQQSLNKRTSTECFKGHLWTNDNIIMRHNGTKMVRSCRKCLDNRLKNKSNPQETV